MHGNGNSEMQSVCGFIYFFVEKQCVVDYYVSKTMKNCYAPLQSPLIANVAKNDVNGVRRYAGMPNRIKEKGK